MNCTQDQPHIFIRTNHQVIFNYPNISASVVSRKPADRPKKKRITVTMNTEIYAKLVKIQTDEIRHSTHSVFFSAILDKVLRKALK